MQFLKQVNSHIAMMDAVLVMQQWANENLSLNNWMNDPTKNIPSQLRCKCESNIHMKKANDLHYCKGESQYFKDNNNSI